ncbi:MAG: hypothetical protein A2V90_02730 [Gammaproteobacteria bacterium RBG_16_57_12]|nr:MAG: hypothetical protein A2V90_02730 [Gammaproteobacteria bacterium RBG_16_57_12]
MYPSTNTQPDAVMATPLASVYNRLAIHTNGQQLLSIDFLPEDTALQSPRTQVAQRVVTQLRDYFLTPGYRFDLPLSFTATEFQQRVWHCLQAIPPGETLTYGELAGTLGTSARAIGNACRNNPIPIIVPCHRVLARQGRGGYCGQLQGEMLAIKQWLLQHESARGQ